MIRELREAFARCGSLADAILVGLRHTPSWSVVEVVVQGEFTHDVVMAAAPDGPAIVLDCT
jgi:hypothetical protein